MKFYQNREWLYKRYMVQKKSIDDIAKECGVTTMTIYRALKEKGIVK